MLHNGVLQPSVALRLFASSTVPAALTAEDMLSKDVLGMRTNVVLMLAGNNQ